MSDIMQVLVHAAMNPLLSLQMLMVIAVSAVQVQVLQNLRITMMDIEKE